ncbi:hypothetical protein CXB51_031183 [Gossypium anomalum]|uniref:Uncharacterized protein n=1 Tax=Gossypium anomalum TaxID=47600 RepID=A0A8J5Y4D5_9ROSI|nr:hypothetical protein CXB51_031183 [Gossypium anomalum]
MGKSYHVLLNHFLSHLRCLFDPVVIYSKTTAFHGLGVCSLVLFSPYMRKGNRFKTNNHVLDFQDDWA